MQKLGAALLILLGLVFAAPAHAENSIGPSNLIVCNKTAMVAVASATTTSLAAGITGQQISICGWDVTSTQATSTTFQLEYGTQGGPCTTPTTITPAFNITSTAPAVDRQQYATISIPVGAQLCVVTTGGTIGEAIMIWFAQF